MPFEIVIHVRGVKDEVVSPMTYPTSEDAAGALEPIHEAIAAEGVVRLPWYGGKAANIIDADVRSVDTTRPADTRDIEELVAVMARLLGTVSEHDDREQSG
ncbi:MAG: hypothetical protein M3O90_04000 [Actinomycetota bacterium]|nr:hypothetical protein [Actinomycetota bacterium]